MRVQREFTVAMPIDRAWDALDRVQELTSQLPGVDIEQQGPDQFGGTVSFALGAFQVAYRGTGSISERDVANHTAVINLDGADQHGGRRGHARVRVTMHADTPDRTRLALDGQVGFGASRAGAADQVLARVYEQAAKGMASRLAGARTRVGVDTPPGQAHAGGMRLTFSPAEPPLQDAAARAGDPSESQPAQGVPRGEVKTGESGPSQSETDEPWSAEVETSETSESEKWESAEDESSEGHRGAAAKGARPDGAGGSATAPPVEDLSDQIADFGASARAALSSTPGVGLLGAAAGAVLTWRISRRR